MSYHSIKILSRSNYICPFAIFHWVSKFFWYRRVLKIWEKGRGFVHESLARTGLHLGRWRHKSANRHPTTTTRCQLSILTIRPRAGFSFFLRLCVRLYLYIILVTFSETFLAAFVFRHFPTFNATSIVLFPEIKCQALFDSRNLTWTKN